MCLGLLEHLTYTCTILSCLIISNVVSVSFLIQGRDVLQRKYSKPFFTRAPKVKVHGGSTPSQARIPVDQEIIVDLRQMEQRRDYAHFVYKRRLDQVRARHQGTVSNFILPHLFG